MECYCRLGFVYHACSRLQSSYFLKFRCLYLFFAAVLLLSSPVRLTLDRSV